MDHQSGRALQQFRNEVGLRFQLYNSLFTSLPFHRIEKTGILLSLLSNNCEEGYKKKLSPVDIVEDFFSKHTIYTNVGALAASTLNIRDEDFLGGNYLFTGSGGSITNQGQISAAPGGYLAFISPVIPNSGTLSAPQGTVAMGAGERVRLNFAGDRLVGLDVSAAAIDTLIENRQAIRAEGGAILLTAAGAEAVTRGVINNSGVLEASSLTSDGGRIVLTAGNDINLGAGSTVAVDGKKGGDITVQARTGTLLADGSLRRDRIQRRRVVMR